MPPAACLSSFSETVRHRGIEVSDEALDPLLEMLLGGEVATAEKPANQDREPDLDLLEPRSGSRPRGGREVAGDPVTGIAQERLVCRRRLKDAGFALLAMVFGPGAIR
jgi:hypothetical protein